MRKIEIFLLFLLIPTANFFLAIPCKAQNFPNNNDLPVYPPTYSPISQQNYYPASPELSYSSEGRLRVIENNPRPPSGKIPNIINYQDPVAYPQASDGYSTDYNGEYYY